MRVALLAVVAALLVAVPGGAARPSLAFRATAPPRLDAGTRTVTLRIRSSGPARVAATLYAAGQRRDDWRFAVDSGRSVVRLPLRPADRRTGRYTLFLAATADGETVYRTLRYRVGLQ